MFRSSLRFIVLLAETAQPQSFAINHCFCPYSFGQSVYGSIAHRDTPLCRLFDIGIVVVVVVVVLRVPLELVGAGDGYAVVCYCRNPKYTRRLRFVFYVH